MEKINIDYYSLIPDLESEFVVVSVEAPKKKTAGLMIRFESPDIPFIINQYYGTLKDGRLQLMLMIAGVEAIPHDEIVPDDVEFYEKKLKGVEFNGKMIKATRRRKAGYLLILPSPYSIKTTKLQAKEQVEFVKEEKIPERIAESSPIVDIEELLSEEDIKVLNEENII